MLQKALVRIAPYFWQEWKWGCEVQCVQWRILLFNNNICWMKLTTCSVLFSACHCLDCNTLYAIWHLNWWKYICYNVWTVKKKTEYQLIDKPTDHHLICLNTYFRRTHTKNTKVYSSVPLVYSISEYIPHTCVKIISFHVTTLKKFNFATM